MDQPDRNRISMSIVWDYLRRLDFGGTVAAKRKRFRIAKISICGQLVSCTANATLGGSHLPRCAFGNVFGPSLKKDLTLEYIPGLIIDVAWLRSPIFALVSSLANRVSALTRCVTMSA